MGHREISRELVSTALPTGVSTVVTNLTGLIDMGTMIGCISYFGCGFAPPSGVSEEELPHFVYGSFAGIALTVFNLVLSVTNMLRKGILPSVTEAWENHDVKALSQRTMQALLTAAVIAAPAACGMAALSGEVLHFLFPKQSDEVEICINSLRLLMPGMVCLCLSFPIFSMLQAIGKPSSPLKIMLLGAAVKLVGNLALIPILGADGAALSTSVCYGLILAVSLRFLLKKTGIRLRIKPFGAVAYSGAMFGGSAYFVSDILEMRGFGEVFTLFCAVAVGGAVYLASAYAMRDTLGFGSQTVRISKNTI
ncbi:MAG: polysaccharide biosynthesis C-terminal domain-containing protein [Ruminococcus sp.]|nr:polysaccharide biosynthesis C-terminal domain-containing protein [Ruminococcus sp.]